MTAVSLLEARNRSGAWRQDRRAGRSSALFSRGRSGWVAILLAVLVAFSWQSFLAQAHEHFGRGGFASVSAATTRAAPDQHDRKAPSGLPDNCWICRAVAHSGHLVLPQVFDFDPAAPSDVWLAIRQSTEQALAQRSHAWQSRAPPSSLQA
jgi:hypothetical protein